MWAELGSKSLAGNNHRINEDAENNRPAIVANTRVVISENTCILNVIPDNSVVPRVIRLFISALLLVSRVWSVTAG